MRAVRHIGVVVADMDRALGFYRDLLGLRVARTMDESGAYLDNLLDVRDARVLTVKLSAEDGPTLVELLQFEHPSTSGPDSRDAWTRGPSHVAFTVDDLDGLYARLQSRGIRFNSPPQLSPDGYAKVTFCRDPEGTLVELVEVLRRDC